MLKVANKLSEEGGEMCQNSKEEFARVIIHEYHHTIGYGSEIDRLNYRADPAKLYEVEWVKDYPIRKKEIVQQPKIDVKLRRYERALENLRIAETRLKRAKTLHRKWKDKVSYYQKVYNYK